MKLRETDADDDDAIAAIHCAAFGQEEEARLVRDLLADPTAKPCLSLIAERDGLAIGHVLFTHARLRGTAPEQSASILAPLAVLPANQSEGVGAALVRDGLRRLAERDCAHVFVLGDPAYYGRFGFRPAGAAGFAAPHPLPERYAEAWMHLALSPQSDAAGARIVACADALDKPHYWAE